MLHRLFCLFVCVVPTGVWAGEWLDPTGIDGSLVIAGGGKLSDRITERFLELGGGAEAKLVIVPTAGTLVDDPEKHAEILQPWQECEVASVTLLHTRDRETAASDEFLKPLREATAVWFSGGQQSRIAEAYVGTEFEAALAGVLERGGVIGGTSAGAAIQSRLMIASGNPVPVLKQGFDLLPDAVIDQHFLKRNRKPRSMHALKERPGHFGIGIGEGTAVIVRGRSISVMGESTATVMLPAGAGRPPTEFPLKAGNRADLTALRRAARDRAADQPFPATESRPVHVASGSLMIVGGGGFPEEMARRFIELAGGPDAGIVILPVSSTDALRSGNGMKRYLERFGASRVTVLPERTRDRVESDEALDALRNAGGLWFGGGRQWRFMDAYEGTKAEPLFHDVLKRGGVIGGSSAGASIQTEYMVRGNPLGNTDMMAAGYERGLGFLPGATVDQHFTQRNRHADLDSVIKTHPQLLGIGIDETTAVIVKGDSAEVVGRHSAYFIESEETEAGRILDRIRVGTGGTFDLKLRKTIRPSAPPLPEQVPRRRRTRTAS